MLQNSKIFWIQQGGEKRQSNKNERPEVYSWPFMRYLILIFDKTV